MNQPSVDFFEIRKDCHCSTTKKSLCSSAMAKKLPQSLGPNSAVPKQRNGLVLACRCDQQKKTAGKPAVSSGHEIDQ
jgi:hypothetical protein